MLQFYIMRQAFWPFAASVSALAILALLTQSIATLDLIIDQRQSVFTYLQITLLALPQLIALILPIALFIAVAYAANRFQSDSEAAVCSSAGMSRWQIAEPIFKLAILALIANLAINLWVQPAAYREMRLRLFEVRGDLAARLVQPGQFSSPAEGLTIYARDITAGGRLTDILIEDARDEETEPIVYMAQAGVFVDVNGEPALRMANGSIQSVDQYNALSHLQFDSYTFVLSTFLDRPSDVFYKLSDRYLHELLVPDPNNLWDWRFRNNLLAEGHYRLSAPLYNAALALVALAGVFGGSFSRIGYTRRIIAASVAALGVRLVGFAIQSACNDYPELNALQYALPIVTGFIAYRVLVGRSPRRKLRRRRRFELVEPAPA